MIEVKNIQHTIKSKEIIKNLSVTIKPGCIPALVGPNGSGKTSLLRLISGEWRLQKGSILFEDVPIREWTQSELACRRAVLSQSIELAFDFSVQDVIMLAKTPFQGKLRGVIKKKTVKELLEWIGLPGIERKTYNELSGGEKKRVQIARVLAQLKAMPKQEARYLLLDEPEAHLDLGWKAMPLKAAQKQAQEGVGVLVALHDLNLAARYANQVVLISKGRLIAAGKPENVLVPENIRQAYGLTEKAYEENFSYADSMALV